MYYNLADLAILLTTKIQLGTGPLLKIYLGTFPGATKKELFLFQLVWETGGCRETESN